MSDKEIALQLTLKLLETGHFRSGDIQSNAEFGSAIADIYNAILQAIHCE